MKLVIIIVLVLALLGGGGGAGWWFFLREAPTDEAVVEAEAEQPLPVNHKRIFELKPFNLPIMREGQVTQHLAIVMRLELAEPEDKDVFKETLPRLRDALFSELHGIFAFRHIQEGGENLPIVRDRLIAAGNGVLGEGRIKTIFVQAANRRLIADG